MPNLPKNHYDLNTKYDTNEKHKRNFQILNLRYHQYMELEGSFVTDRSLYDTAGYEIQENSLGLPTCETHDFIEKIKVFVSKICLVFTLFLLIHLMSKLPEIFWQKHHRMPSLILWIQRI